MKEEFFVVGEVLAPWGVRGDVKVRVVSDYPGRFTPKATVFIKGAAQEIEASRTLGGGLLLVKLAGVKDRTQAETLRGQLLEIPESALMPLQPQEYFQHQIIGLHVRTTDGRPLGKVAEVLRTGSNDVYVVREERKEYLIPATEDVVKEIDLPGGHMTIEVIPGLLE